MTVRLKPVREQVIVITGASSGIGLATAREAAARGARVVLVARNAAVLDATAREIAEAGGEAMPVAGDVSRREDLERVAEATLARFGAFDTWVNNAGVSAYGRLEEVSEEDGRRIFETNFWGSVYGSLIAVKHLKARGGALITVGSIASDTPLPLQGMYSASKHALQGFIDSLRIELEHEGASVSVTLIKPASINSPFTRHAKNYTEHEPQLPPPAYPPEEVAYAILRAASHPEREIYVGGSGKLMAAASILAPRLTDKLSQLAIPLQQRPEPRQDGRGTLTRPGRDGEVHGDHPGLSFERSFYTRAATHPVLTGGLLAVAAGVLAAALLRGPASREPR